MSSPHLNGSAFADPLIKDLFSVMFISINGMNSGKSVIKTSALQNSKNVHKNGYHIIYSKNINPHKLSIVICNYIEQSYII